MPMRNMPWKVTNTNNGQLTDSLVHNLNTKSLIPGFPALGHDKSSVQTSILLSRNIYTIAFTDQN
jgi:hypothetical protein